MILLAKKDITLNVDTEKAYSYLTNMENYGDWFPGVSSIASANNLAHSAVGKKYTEHLTLPTGESTLTIEVTRSEQNTAFYTEGDLHPLYPAMAMTFKRLNKNDTQFTIEYFSRSQEATLNQGMLSSLQNDLSERLDIAETNLQRIFA
ncbi:SRPBCC family protein [Pseudoalteromonas piscicida]|uniref:SRPBCC family protein n=1 Tax=Pseudoalteromonas piscicida TaxID=43662 RepID=A0A2A5JJS9_PSEO7|nr:SRPBCC family protein [Pseudoalteromonas piscicida]PCK29657.1 hypothetical protein CEX98_21495 [Pseudoalteromonas piscicida]